MQVFLPRAPTSQWLSRSNKQNFVGHPKEEVATRDEEKLGGEEPGVLCSCMKIATMLTRRTHVCHQVSMEGRGV